MSSTDPSTDRVVRELLSHRARSATSSVIRDLLRHADRDDVISLAGGIPAPELFPLERIADSAQRALAEVGATAAQYGLTEGVTDLRELLAARESLDAPAHPANLIVTTGSQQALDLIARVLVDPGDVVVADDPAYLGALQAVRGYGPQLVGIEVDAQGINTDRLAELLASGLDPVLVYTNPNFQNPTGATLSVQRREHLAELADRHDFLIVEDDPYGALRFEGERLPSMAAFSDRVVRVRSVSKTLAPGLRVAWLIGPEPLIEAITIAKQAVDLHTSTLTQHVALSLLSDTAWYERHEQRLVPWYRQRRDALEAAVERAFGDQLAFDRPDGGMFLWAELDDALTRGRDTADLLSVALDCGVAFVPGSAFAVDQPRPAHLRLSFATASPDELEEAATRLQTAVRRWGSSLSGDE